MSFTVRVIPSAVELWGTIHLDANGMDGSRVAVHGSRAEAEMSAGYHTRHGTAAVRVARFTDSPFWLAGSHPPPVVEDGSGVGASEPVLVVTEGADGRRAQQVACWRPDDDEPGGGRWVSACPSAWTLEGVVNWRYLDWPT